MFERSVLLSKPADGEVWSLPGGRVEDGETDIRALKREVFKATGLEIDVGTPHIFGTDTAIAYHCTIAGGCREDVSAKYYDRKTISKIKIVGPDDRLDCIGRMIWDALSLGQVPIVESNQILPEHLPVEGIFVSDDGLSFVKKTSRGREIYRRLDPYDHDGFMQAPAQ